MRTWSCRGAVTSGRRRLRRLVIVLDMLTRNFGLQALLQRRRAAIVQGICQVAAHIDIRQFTARVAAIVDGQKLRIGKQ